MSESSRFKTGILSSGYYTLLWSARQPSSHLLRSFRILTEDLSFARHGFDRLIMLVACFAIESRISVVISCPLADTKMVDDDMFRTSHSADQIFNFGNVGTLYVVAHQPLVFVESRSMLDIGKTLDV